MTSSCSKWEPVSGIVGPCGSISVSYSGGMCGSVTLHFAAFTGLPAKDLLIHFRTLVALKYETECPGFEPDPTDLPKCSEPAMAMWTFPLLKIEGDPWLAQYQQIYQATSGAAPLSHFFFVSMGDLVHVVACADAVAEWIAVPSA